VTLFLDHPELLPGFRDGDARVLERVYWAYVERTEATVRARLRDIFRVAAAASDVADLVQETFARAFSERARLGYDGTRPYAPLIATIARNLVVDHARRHGREVAVEEVPDTPPEPESEPEPWAEPAIVRAVESYLATLDPELKRVHERRYVHCESQEDAARALGTTRQRVRTLERKLRDGLAEYLRNQDSGAPVEIHKRKATHG
jgi:RNA polymerase sigma factor (sigma-70 family)